MPITCLLQEQAHDAKQQAVSPEDTEDLSPLPSAVQQPARRRGGISAEPVSEEDATSYVKKVLNSVYSINVYHWLLDRAITS
jgi:cAMP-dependent protein kinase regulator